MPYTSLIPHVDSATLNMGMTDVIAGPACLPYFTAVGSLAQAGNVLGDPALLIFNFNSYFEGFMTGADPSLPGVLNSLGMSLSGTVGTTPGEFVSLNMTQNYTDAVSLVALGTLTWSYSNITPGGFAATVIPTWAGVPLTNNLITIAGTLVVQADPSTISFSLPASVPEPGSLALLSLGALLRICSRPRRN